MDKSSRIVICSKTGEIDTVLSEGDRIVRKASTRAANEKKEKDKSFMSWNVENFIKANIPEMQLLLKELSSSEKAFLFSISPYISYEDCHLQYRNGVDIGTSDLIDITGMSRSLVYEMINSLVQKDILYKGKNSRNRQFFVNPWLFSKGNRVNRVLRTMFKNYKIRVLGGRRWKDIRGD